ncbi:MAG: alpha/beta fold hydrolase [Paracoccaceae bacterium]
MTAEKVKRGLAAILVADVVGFSRLVGVDEVGTIEELKLHRSEFIDPLFERFAGRIFNTTGDGFLVEFSSVVDAVTCAMAMQQGMANRNSKLAEQKRLVLRIGINVGDVIIDGEDILGEGVNIAARLEALCEPGGICISRSAHDHVRDKIHVAFQPIGPQSVKNISRPVEVFSLGPSDIWESREGDGLEHPLADDKRPPAGSEHQAANQKVMFCKSFDGVQIAYATAGEGPPLVKAPNWMTHLEYEWDSPVWRHFVREMSAKNTLVRFDQRGNGLSDWDVDEISFEAFVKDLETVVDTLGLEKFPLLGISQGCPISVAYAARHPERVSHLVLYGGFTRGASRRDREETERSEALNTLIRSGWGQDNPAFRQFYTTNLIPDGTKEQMDWYNDLMRISVSPDNAVRLRKSFSEMDVTELLPQILAPTLVIHARNDAIAPFKEGRKMAAEIPNARFVALEGNNHILLEDEPAWPRFVDEVQSFIANPT